MLGKNLQVTHQGSQFLIQIRYHQIVWNPNAGNMHLQHERFNRSSYNEEELSRNSKKYDNNVWGMRKMRRMFIFVIGDSC